MEEVTYCSDLKDKPGFPGCCGSCHDDADMGFFYELCEVYDGERLTGRYCCKVYNWVSDGYPDQTPVKS